MFKEQRVQEVQLLAEVTRLGSPCKYACTFYKQFKSDIQKIIIRKHSQIFRQETPSGSRPNRAYLIKELDGTCVSAHQREAPTDINELLIPYMRKD